MLKQYIKEQGLSLAELSRKTGIPYSTLNDMVNNKIAIDNCKAGYVRQLAGALDIPMETLMDLNTMEDSFIEFLSNDISAKLFVRLKSYHVSFRYQDRDIDLELGPVNKATTYYAREMARWAVEDYIAEAEWRERRALHSDAQE